MGMTTISFSSSPAASGSDECDGAPGGGCFRAGIGAFRVESDYTTHKFLVNVPTGSQSARYSLTRWTMGAIVGTGLRFGSERMRAMPTVEARLVLEPGASGERTEL